MGAGIEVLDGVWIPLEAVAERRSAGRVVQRDTEGNEKGGRYLLTPYVLWEDGTITWDVDMSHTCPVCQGLAADHTCLITNQGKYIHRSCVAELKNPEMIMEVRRDET